MTLRRSTFVAWLATVLALTLGLAVPAHAADPTAAAKATAWLGQQTIDDPGQIADSLIALAAANDPAQAATVDRLVTALKEKGAAYAAGSPEAAAKAAVALEAAGEDPRTALGTDLIATVKNGIAADGSFGSYPGPFASGLAAVALTRADEDVPAALGTYLLTFHNSDGGFTYQAGQPSDADSTALALQALTALGDDASVTKTVAWADQNIQADGSYTGFNPVNSTAVMAAALATAGKNVDASVVYLVSQQQTDGSFLNAGAPDVLATAQAALGLSGVSYLDATWSPTAGPARSSPECRPAPPRAPGPPPPRAPAPPAASASASASATPGAATSATPAGWLDPSAWIGSAAAVIVLLGAAVVGLRRTSAR